MAKQAISVTLEVDNLAWLKGRAGPAGARSVSELLDQLVTAARKAGRVGPARSVVGTIGIDASDPTLERADRAVRALFEASQGKGLAVSKKHASYRVRARPKKRRG